MDNLVSLNEWLAASMLKDSLIASLDKSLENCPPPATVPRVHLASNNYLATHQKGVSPSNVCSWPAVATTANDHGLNAEACPRTRRVLKFSMGRIN